jgi:putative transposase
VNGSSHSGALALYQGMASAVQKSSEKELGFSPRMSRPLRNSRPEEALSPSRTFFATTKTNMGQRILQSERNAGLLIDILRGHVAAGRFTLQDFVIMPDHVHLLLTVEAGMSIEKAMQLIKGGFSFRLSKEFGFAGEVWQKGFSEVRVNDEASFLQHRAYIAANPVKAGLAAVPAQYPFCYTFLANRKAAGAKAQSTWDSGVAAGLKSSPDTKH